MNSNWSYSPETPNLGQIRRLFEPCDLEICWLTLKNNRALLLNITKLCASFHHHMWIQTGVTVRKRLSWVLTSVTLTFDLWSRPFAWTSLLSLVMTPENFMMIRWWEHSQQGKSEGFVSCDWPIVRKRPIWVKIGDALYRVTLKFDGWPWKTIGHLSFAVSSFVQHFIAIGEFKLELQSGTPNSGQIPRFLEPCDLEIWPMTLKNNRAPLLFYFKLCASFHNHWCIETWVTVRKRPIWV